MQENNSMNAQDNSYLGWKGTLAICALLFLLGAGIVAVIFSTEPTATRGSASKDTAMLVEVTQAEIGDFRPVIEVMGTVTPAREVVLRPRVSGKVVRLAEDFTPGGNVQEGQGLLRIDPEDYKNSLEQKKSELRQAKADLNRERGKQDVAESDYRALDKVLPPEKSALMLRQPQMNSTLARVESARAAVDQARLELRRTSIEAPFDAQILERRVNIGSQVSVGDNLARLVGVETYWVEATVPVSKLKRLSFPQDKGEKGSKARIRDRAAWEESQFREGHMYKLVGSLEDRTRMARVLITVKDPLALDSPDKPSMLIGAYVQARIQGGELEDVIRLNRDYVRKEDTVWVMQQGKLQIRDLDIAFRDKEYAYIKSGLEDGEKVVTTNLTTVVEGSKLRLKEDSN